MAAVFASAAVGAASSTTADVVVALPSGTASGDLLLAFLAAGTGSATWTASGWTSVGDGTANTAAYWKWAGGSEPSTYTFTRSTTGSSVAYGTVIRVTGADTTTPVQAFGGSTSGSGASSAPASSSALTAASTNTLAVEAFAMAASTGTVTVPGAVTSAYDLTSTGTARRFFGGTKAVNSGAVSADTWTWSASVQWRGGTFLVNPASTGATGTLAATLPPLAASTSGSVTVFGPMDATLPPLSTTNAGSAVPTGVLDATLPPLSTAMAGGPPGGTVFGDLIATLPALSAAGESAVTEYDGGVGFAEELPDDDLPAAEIPDPRRLIRTVAWSVPPVELDDKGRPTEAWKAGAAEFNGTWGSYQLFVGGEDVTTFRDMPFQMPIRQHANPFGYKALEVVLPGVTPWTWSQRETDPAVSSWLTPWAPVVLRVVDEAGVSTVLWRGFIGAESPEAQGLHLTCAGEARGRLEMDLKTLRPFVFRKDIGVALYDLARRPGLHITPTLGIETGIVMDERSRSQGTLLECIDELCALSQDTNGDTVTFSPTGPNGNVYEMHYQDNETVDYTVFYGAYGISADLQSNILDHPTTLIGHGRESDGGFWANIKAPGLFPTTPPAFPGTLSLGDTGPDVNALKLRLQGVGVLDRQESHDEEGFGEATEDAVEVIQERAGLAQTGIVNEATWNAAYDIGVTGTSLALAHQEPLDEDPATRRYLTNATGVIIGPNPAHDPLRPKVTEDTDYGVYQKRQARKRARRRRIRLAQAKAYTGTARFDSDLFQGDYHHGDPDPVVVSRFVPLEGKNIMLRGFDGDVLLHVAEDDKDTTGASVTVSTLVIPPLEVRQLVDRNREGRGSNPAKTFRRQHRGTEIPGPIDFWSEIGGEITTRQTLEGGKWNVLDPVVAGDMGTLAQVGLELEDAVEFVAVLFAVPVNQAWVRDTLPDPFAMPKAWQHTTVRQLRKTIMLEFWGDKDNPAGYGPDGSKADGDPVTGILLDQAGIPYRTFARDDINNGKRCLLYWAVHPQTDTAIGPQRCLWPNPEVGM